MKKYLPSIIYGKNDFLFPIRIKQIGLVKNFIVKRAIQNKPILAFLSLVILFIGLGKEKGFGQSCLIPAEVDAGTDIHVCSGGTASMIAIVSGSATSIVSWSGGVGTYSYPNSPDLSQLDYTPDPSEVGTVVTLTVTTDDPDGAGPCTAATDQVQITVDNPFVVDAGPNIRVCISGGSVNLSGVIGGGTISAYWSGGLGNISDINDLNAVYTPDISEAGTDVTLSLTPVVGNNVCPVSSSDVIISVDDLPIVNAGSDLSSCSGGTVTLNGSVSNSTGGIWSAGLGIFSPDANTLNATYSPDISEINSTVTLTLTTTDPLNICPSSVDFVDIVVEQVTVDAGPDIRVCEDGTVNLSGIITGGSGTGQWFGGLGIFTPDRYTLNAVYTPDPTEAGTTVTLTLSSDASVSCPSVTNDVVITVDQLPAVNAGPDIATCIDGTVSLSGISGGGTSSVLWTGGAGSFDDPTSLTAIYTPDQSEAGTIVMLTLNGYGANGTSCIPAFSQVAITVDAIPTANVGSDQTICYGDIVSLTGSITNGTGSGSWTTSGDGSFDNSLSLTPVYTPGSNDLSSGMVTLTLTPDAVGVCPAVSDFIDVTIRPAIIAHETVVNETCNGGDGSISLAPTGGDNISYSYLWNGGSTNNNILALSANDYTVTITDGSGCNSEFTFTITAPSPSACTVTLNLTAFIQGYYIGSNQMNSVLLNSGVPASTSSQCDTIEVSLMNSSSPYNLVATIKGIINIDGTASLVYPATGIYGNSYYIRILHRNSLETWSSAPLMMNTISSYDFTFADTQAYGATQVEVEPGKWALWSGDITDGNTLGVKDGVIESFDYSQLENDYQNFLFGYYISDLNGDGVVESADYSLIENNYQLFIFGSHP